MKVLVSVCLVAFFFCVGLAWWVRTAGRSADGRLDACRNDEVRPGITANRKIRSGWQDPQSWIPADAEREDDRGAFLTWIPADAERENDHGAFLTWVPADAEREDDRGAFLTWIATDAERDDDIGLLIRPSRHSL